MTYPEALQYLESFVNYEKILQWSYKESLKLERIKEFLSSIDSPQDSLKCIHIAGSKGKGSTCAFVAYILREAGYRVGLYTSPHLSDFRERIRILAPRSTLNTPRSDFEGMVSRRALADLVTGLKPYIEKFNTESKYGPLSFFEAYTSLAFVYFKEKRVDFAVLETGLGGRLDATNVVSPLVCAVTPISYEHTQKLGNTLAEIAKEKAGIIKAQSSKLKAQSSIVISAPQEKEVREVFRKRCLKAGARLYEVNKDIFFKNTKLGFSARGIFRSYPDLKIRLLGRHQLINASLAIGIIEALRFYNTNVNIDAIKKGLYNTLWPGRCEVILRQPLVVLDGAQNRASAAVLREAVKDNFKYKKLILILGICADKDIKGICEVLSPLADEIILTEASNPRATSVNFIEQIMKKQKLDCKIPITKTKNVKEAKANALQRADRQDLILVSGSLFVVGEFRNG